AIYPLSLHDALPIFGVGRTIVVGAAATGPAGLLVPLASPDTAVLLIGASFFLVSICNVVYNVSQVSLRQAITPDALLGRMNASRSEEHTSELQSRGH